jgi:hypothetical protein
MCNNVIVNLLQQSCTVVILGISPIETESKYDNQRHYGRKRNYNNTSWLFQGALIFVIFKIISAHFNFSFLGVQQLRPVFFPYEERQCRELLVYKRRGKFIVLYAF